ncbi:hypothetical protein [Aurantimonas sp. 22II-16-19i]|uniref:hypothetical protein n=1 Tax=Aurantimonas sp. 22II-16-19i TaxID=1317114 RepID=UPI0009F7C960|nr:hypothetical protein [Aurantimonas sp. 22II-16-19i]ORE92341.1 hypothetical protein ATO4_17507 [Aurantimonas sp. 22II-16-19i]
MVDELLDAAAMLAGEASRNPSCGRRAVSTAYYAVFHALSDLATGCLLPGVSNEAEDYVRIYRSLDHGPLKNAFIQAPLKDNPRLRPIGGLIAHLQSERVRADYLPADPLLFPHSQVLDLVLQASQIVQELRALTDDDRRKLAVCLLFRTRKD